MTAPKDESEAVAAKSAEPIDTRLVRRLAHILTDTGLTEIEVERGDLRVRVAREAAVSAAPMLASIPVQAAAPVAAAQAAEPPAARETPIAEPASALARGDVVKSPMVGTVYLQPSPGSDPFVQPGGRVSQGQTLLIIEAMKTMNPIPAPKAGVVLEILVEDGQPVEYGEPLVVIE